MIAALLDSIEEQNRDIELTLQKWSTLELTESQLQELNQDVRHRLKTLKERLNQAEDAIEDLDRPADRVEFKDKVQHLHRQHQRLTQAHRTASLQTHKMLAEKQQAERDELLRFSDSKTFAEKRISKLKSSGEAGIVDQAQEITKAMQTAVKMLNEEVQKSHEMNKLLDSSTQNMSSTRNLYTTIRSSLRISRSLSTKLANRDFKDRLFLFLGFGMFLLSVLYVLRKRISFDFGIGFLFHLVWNAIMLLVDTILWILGGFSSTGGGLEHDMMEMNMDADRHDHGTSVVTKIVSTVVAGTSTWVAETIASKYAAEDHYHDDVEYGEDAPVVDEDFLKIHDEM